MHPKVMSGLLCIYPSKTLYLLRMSISVQLYRRILREKEIACCMPLARNGRPRTFVPVIISLRRTIRENRI